MKVLGRVAFVGHDKHGTPWARVVPLLVLDPPWRAAKPGEFPPEDKIFWPHADEADEDLMFICRADYNEAQGKDHYIVSDATPVLDLLDLRAFGDAEAIRMRFAAGFQYKTYVPANALLRCAGDEVIGPVRLKSSSSGGLTYDVPSRDRIPRFALKDVDVREVKANGRSRFVVLSTLPAPAAYVDWDSDEMVLGRALKWAAKHAFSASGEVAISEKMLVAAAKQIAAAGPNAEVRLREYQLTRARSCVETTRDGAKLAESVVAELLEHPTIAAELQSTRLAVRAEVEAAVRGDLKAETEKLEATRAEHAALQKQLDDTQVQIDAARAQIEAQLVSVDAEIGKKLSEVLDRPAKLLADVAILRAALPLSTPATAGASSGQRARGQQVRWAACETVLTTKTEVMRALASAFTLRGIDPLAAFRIHAALAAGLMPVLVGPLALAALDAYAGVACGARTVTVHVTPTFVQPSDMFGKLESARGEFVVHPAGLLDAVQVSPSLAGYGLAILEGINRAPTESFLLPLLQRRERVHLFHPTAVPTHDELPPSVSWPTGLWLAATSVAGPTSLPVSRDIWQYAVAIDVRPSGSAETKNDAPRITEVAPRGEHMDPVGVPQDLVDDLLESYPEAGEVRRVLQRLGASFARYTTNKDDLRATLVEAVLLPLVTTSPDEGEREEVVENLVQGLPDDRAEIVRSAAKRLRQRFA